jgi:hypothetical protein
MKTEGGFGLPDNFFEIFGFYRCPKIKAARDERYKAWIRTQKCAVCGKPAPSVVMHQRILQGGGTGMKPSDYETLPGCQYCHDLEGQKGFLTLWDHRSGLEFSDKTELRDHIRALCQTLVKSYQNQKGK